MNFISRASAPDEQRWRLYNKIGWRLLPLILIGYTIACIDRLNVSFAKLQMAEDLALSNAMYGFGAGVFFIGYCFCEIPSNIILHKVGARFWLARIMVVWGIITVATLFVTTPLQFYIARFALGVAKAGFYPGALLFLTYWFPRFARGQATSIMLIGTNLAALTGGPLAGVIMSGLDGAGGMRGWQWLYLLEGLPAVAMGIVVWVVLRNSPRDAHWLSDDEKAMVAGDLEAEQAQIGGGRRHVFSDAFRNLNIWFLVAVNFCNLCIGYGMQFWIPTIVSQVTGAGVLATGLITSAISICPIILLIFYARHSDQTDERRWHGVVGFAISLCGLILAGLSAGDPRLTLAAIVITVCGVQATSAIIFSLPAMFANGAAVATSFALITTIGNLAGYASPYMIGIMREAFGDFSLVFFGLAAIAALGVTLFFLIPALRKRAPPLPLQGERAG